MKLRHIFTTLVLTITTFFCQSAPTLPTFSNGDEDNWYYIVFTAGETVLGDQGNGVSVITRIANPTRDNQLWKFIGTPEDFQILGKEGNYIYYETRVRTTNDPAKAGHFRLVPSPLPEMADSWEIEYPAKEDEWNRWNQWGNTGPGVNIGLYTPGERNNALKFLPQAELPVVPELTKINEFKTTPIENYTPEHRHTLWFNEPATAKTGSDAWMEYGLPIGNGEFGAMTFGGIAQDRIQFNDKSLWTGSTKNRGSYQNFGDIYIEDISGVFGNTDETTVKNYVRSLDMCEGKVNVSYTSPDGNVNYTREYIASYPDKAVAIRLGASQPGKISVRIRLFSGVKLGMLAPEYKDGEISIEGLLDLVSFKAKVKAVPTGGTIVTKDDCIEIKDADDLTIILAGATNFDQHSPTYISDVNAMYQLVDNRVASAASKGWDAILTDHIADFKQYFDRAEFRIDAAANTRAGDAMVTRYNGRRPVPSPTDPSGLMLEELYYAMGRYLLISCSRGMDTPANLQGIWNHSNTPAWQCDIHSNINVQMNYWPAEITNLSEMHMPYLNYIYSMAIEHDQWQEYARRSGQTTGWTCFTQNNIFGHSDYAENYVIANAWYTSHMWQHYIYTLDSEFLKNKAMPVMLSCTRFWMERLVKDTDGTWVAPKEWSPEHGPAEEDATAHAQQIIHELFKTTMQAIEILGNDAGVDNNFIAELKDKLENLDKGLAIETYTGTWGATSNGISAGDPLLREWKKSDYTAGENGHRHQSHLMAMYPFGEITPESEWFTPAVNSLKQRGDLSTGWSLAWRIALWARALDGEHAHTVIKNALRHATSYSQTSGGGGIYYNLLDSHAPFQIDGNFGYTAAVTEMLLQSHGGKIRLLPTLSPNWEAGSIRGIKAVGNFEIDQKWADSHLTEAVIKSGAGLECVLNYKGIAEATISDSKGNTVNPTKIDENNVKFPTEIGGVYTVVMPEGSGVAEIADSELQIRIANKIASVSIAGASMKAYDIAGCLLASSEDSSLDLSSLSPGAVIIKATANNKNSVKKFMLD